jgi:RNA polymerase sigma factor (sigma-70 family)
MRRNERFERLREALDALSPDQREVIVLSRIEGLPVLEIAKRMERSPQAVYQLLWRAMKKLKVLFGETESLTLPHRTINHREKDSDGEESR